MKILVTGGSGYFGSLLVKKLIQDGHQCRILDLNPPNDKHQDVQFIKGDIRSLETVNAACEGMDIIHHNVAQVPLAKDVHLFDSVNRQGTQNLLEAALNAKTKKLVYTSSSAVFGVPPQNPVNHNTPLAPREAYGKAKLQGENLCQSYIQRGLDVSIIRPRTIMGHGRLGIFQILFEWIRTGKNIPVLGSGANKYQFIHAEDLADACIKAGERAGPQVYNCGAKEFHSMRDVLSHLIHYAGSDSKIKSVPMGLATFGMTLTSKLGLSPLADYHALMYGRSMYFDTRKIEEDLRWKPQYSNNQMFEESFDWYVKNRHDLLNNEHASHHQRPVKQGILRVFSWVF